MVYANYYQQPNQSPQSSVTKWNYLKIIPFHASDSNLQALQAYYVQRGLRKLSGTSKILEHSKEECRTKYRIQFWMRFLAKHRATMQAGQLMNTRISQKSHLKSWAECHQQFNQADSRSDFHSQRQTTTEKTRLAKGELVHVSPLNQSRELWSLH